MREKVLQCHPYGLSRAAFAMNNSKALILSAQKGDIQAFENLLTLYQNRVFTIALRIVGSPEDALDVTQDVFIRLFRFLSQYRDEKKFFTWLYSIVVNASYDFLKKENRYRALPLEDISPELFTSIEKSEINMQEAYRKILALTEALSSPQKTAFILREVEGFSVKEIAEIFDCPDGTVRSYLYWARKHLRRLLEKHHPELLEG